MATISNWLHTIPLTLTERFTFANAPVAMRDNVSMNYLYQYAASYAMKKPVACNIRFKRSNPTNVIELQDDCLRHSILDLYIWLSFRFPRYFVEKDLCLEQKAYAISRIEKSLESPSLSQKFSHSHAYKKQKDGMLYIDPLGLPPEIYGIEIRNTTAQYLNEIPKDIRCVFPHAKLESTNIEERKHMLHPPHSRSHNNNFRNNNNSSYNSNNNPNNSNNTTIITNDNNNNNNDNNNDLNQDNNIHTNMKLKHRITHNNNTPSSHHKVEKHFNIPINKHKINHTTTLHKKITLSHTHSSSMSSIEITPKSKKSHISPKSPILLTPFVTSTVELIKDNSGKEKKVYKPKLIPTAITSSKIIESNNTDNNKEKNNIKYDVFTIMNNELKSLNK